MNSKGMNGEVGVRIVTLSDCDYCKWLKSELDGQGISYANIDADEHSEFADSIEKKFGVEHYPIVFIDTQSKIIAILSETNLETSDTLRTFDTIPELIGIIKSYIK
jgi:glutaredoxin